MTQLDNQIRLSLEQILVSLNQSVPPLPVVGNEDERWVTLLQAIATGLGELTTAIESLEGGGGGTVWTSALKTSGSSEYSSSSSSFSWEVPAGKEWQIQSCYLNLQTSATAANRFVRCKLTGSTTIGYFVAALAQVAGVQYYYTFAQGYSSASIEAAQFVRVALPSIVLGPGQKIEFEVTNIQAGDVLDSAPELLILERSL